MTAIDYLRSIRDPFSAFVVCINIGCRAFSEARRGVFTSETAEQFTFFRDSLQLLLASRTARRYLENMDVVFQEERTERISDIEHVRMIYLYVDYDKRTYESARKELREILD